MWPVVSCQGRWWRTDCFSLWIEACSVRGERGGEGRDRSREGRREGEEDPERGREVGMRRRREEPGNEASYYNYLCDCSII